MQSKATTVAHYLAELPADRRTALEALRKVILKNLDTKGGFAEGMQYGMIGYHVPHRVYPAGYHCDPKQPLPFAGLASQKNYMSLYLACYSSPEEDKWFRTAWAKSGKKLDMGKCCIRFNSVNDIPLDVVGDAIRRWPVKRYIAHYESAMLTMNKAKAARVVKAKNPSKKTPPSRSGKRTVSIK